MSRPAIVVEDLSKAYKLGARGRIIPSFREAVMSAVASPFRRDRGPKPEPFWALKGVSLEVQPGEVVGLVGRNGSGKSTMLKIISRITEPTEGCVRVRGRLSSLLEVGTGFHPELTGRENVFLNGSILGMSRAEITRKFDEIVAFAEIEQFLDTQVKYYSSGMYVRLAFAVAAHLETQILLVDEVLAVGDAAFQKKCLGRIGEVTKQGRTVIFVSHYMPAVRNLCTRCVYLRSGELVLDGTPDEVLLAYNRATAATRKSDESLVDHSGRSPGSVPAMKRVRVRSFTETPDAIHMGDDVSVDVLVESERPLTDVAFMLDIKTDMGVPVFGNSTYVTPADPLDSPMTRGWVSCRINNLPLMPGDYNIDLLLGTHGHYFDTVYEACRFEVQAADVFGGGKLHYSTSGHVFWPVAWEVRPEEAGEPSPEVLSTETL